MFKNLLTRISCFHYMLNGKVDITNYIYKLSFIKTHLSIRINITIRFFTFNAFSPFIKLRYMQGMLKDICTHSLNSDHLP